MAALYRQSRWKGSVSIQEITTAWSRDGWAPAEGIRYHDVRGQYWKDIEMPMQVIITPIQGQLVYEIGHNKYTLVPGDELVIPANTKYSCKAQLDSKWLYAYSSGGQHFHSIVPAPHKPISNVHYTSPVHTTTHSESTHYVQPNGTHYTTINPHRPASPTRPNVVYVTSPTHDTHHHQASSYVVSGQTTPHSYVVGGNTTATTHQGTYVIGGSTTPSTHQGTYISGGATHQHGTYVIGGGSTIHHQGSNVIGGGSKIITPHTHQGQGQGTYVIGGNTTSPSTHHHATGLIQPITALVVTVVEGQKLEKGDYLSKSDPVCTVTVGSQSHTTRCISNTLDPKWNETFKFKDVSAQTIEISVTDQDLITSDPLGTATIQLNESLRRKMEIGAIQLWVPLQLKGKEAGKVCVILEYEKSK